MKDYMTAKKRMSKWYDNIIEDCVVMAVGVALMGLVILHYINEVNYAN